jgi:hypothetical protein
MSFANKKKFKPMNFSGVITNIEKEGPFDGKYNNNIQKMSSYYKYKMTIDDLKEKTFNHNLPVNEDFPFNEGQQVSFKAYPQKTENEFNVVHRSLAKQMSREEIEAIQKTMENKVEKPEPKIRRPKI